MAPSSQIFCATCKQTRFVAHGAGQPRPNVCYDCLRTSEQKIRKAELERLAALPVEERLALIEAWIYD